MADPHDKEIYKRPYNRPNENWVCGRTAEGRPCPHGPSRRGRCMAQHECVPSKIDDRWVCTRPEQYGGPCDSPALDEPAFGPIVRDGVGVCCKQVHCAPTRSLRNLRGRFSIILCLFIVGGILIALGGTWRNTFLSPGPLTRNHQGASMASLEHMEHGKLDQEGDDSSGSCHICHTSLEGGLEGLLTSAFSTKAALSQSAQCMNCHQEEVGEKALYAHALASDVLATNTEKASAESFDAIKPISLALAAYSPGVKMNEKGELACAACHREHNGALNDLKQVDNQTCQTCHVKQFKSIAQGHPEFTTPDSEAGYAYPYRRRTQIIFSHERHRTNYFRKEENLTRVPEDCTSCHVVEANANTTRLKPFEQMCGACHTESIVSSRDDYIHVFGFPSLESDVYDILEEEVELSPILRSADKKMSPFMALLLTGFNAQDPESESAYAEDLSMLLEFEGDLDGIAYDEDPEIVGRFFEGMRFLQGAAMNGEQGGLRRAVTDQLERLNGGPISPRSIDAMFGFPKPGSTVAKIMDVVSRKDIVEMSGWHVEQSGYQMDSGSWNACMEEVESYTALREAIGGGDAGPYEDVLNFMGSYNNFRTWFDKHCEIDGDDWISRETGKKIKKSEWKALIAAMGAKDGAEDTPAPEDGAEETEPVEEAADSEGEEASGDAPAPQEGAVDADLEEAGDKFTGWVGNMSKVKKWLDRTTNTASNNWVMREPQSLYYRPIMHADPFITEWLNFTAPLYTKYPAAALVFDELSGRKTGSAIGNCMKCHSIDVEKNMAGEALVKVNWTRADRARNFTKFDHSPHLKLMNCAECHRGKWVPAVRELDRLAKAISAEEAVPVTGAEASAAEDGAKEDSAAPSETAEESPAMIYPDSFKAGGEGLEMGVHFTNDGNPPGKHTFISNFEPMTKGDCVRCHVPEKAGDSCLICHNYHIQERNRSFGATSLAELISKDVPVETAAAAQ